MTPSREPPFVDTECCGRITRCRRDECLLVYVFGGGGKCAKCGWIWNMMPDVEATPISPEEMLEAHAPEPMDENK